ncbi:hypothetical protein Bca101_030895 [Brassica carinata]
MSSSDDVVAQCAFNTLRDSVALSRSLLVVYSVFGTRKTSRRKVKSWESLYSSLMRRIRRFRCCSFDINLTSFLNSTIPWPVFETENRGAAELKEQLDNGGEKNPSSLMFYPGKQVEIESVDFSNVCSALGSPLTKSIYFIDGVVRVFFGSDFVTVTV